MQINKNKPEDKHKIVINQIDPCLNYLEKLEPSSFLVYKVKHNEKPHVLKVIHRKYTQNEWFLEQLKTEIKHLQMADGIEGIHKLVKLYQPNNHYTYTQLKNFYEGKTLLHLNKKITDGYAQIRLEYLVKDLHSIGICNMELVDRNILLSPCEEYPSLIDLGGTIYKDDLSIVRFRKYKDNDLRKLEKNIFG
jgi:serine/threonine protein kinase